MLSMQKIKDNETLKHEKPHLYQQFVQSPQSPTFFGNVLMSFFAP